MQEFNNLIKEICDELNINITLLSDNWLTVLEKDNNINYIQGYKFGLNNHALGNIIDDKGLFYDLLTYKHLPIIEHFVIFKDYDEKIVLKYFNNHNREIVIKGNIGTCGSEVFKVNNEVDLFNKINELFLSQFSISLCPYYDIKNEYRVIVLNNESRFVYGKKRPIIIGDGKSSLKELACKFNPVYYQEKGHCNDLIDYIPKEKEEIMLNFQFNLSRGAVLFTDIPSDLKEKLVSLSLDVSKSCGLVFGSVDIILTSDNRLLIMEANSGVMMNNLMKLIPNGKEIARNIYCDAIKLMMEESR